MKTIVRAVGAIFILFSILFFLYGAIKVAKESREKNSTVQLAPGIEIVKDKPEKGMAMQGFTVSVTVFVVGAIIVGLSFKLKK